jgi:hypothetical protein
MRVATQVLGRRLIIPPAPTGGGGVDYGRDIYAWARQPGDQVLTVPNGTYSAGTYNPANPPGRGVVTTNNLTDAGHAATAGPYKGYLILQAETPGQVIVDMSAPGTALAGGVTANGDMYLSGQYVGGTTSNIIFSGFKFQNGAITNAATNIHFWYPEVTHPFSHWSAETGYSPSGAGTNYHGTNDCLFLTYGCVNTRWLGAYFHDIGTGPTLQAGVRSVRMTGFKVGRVDHGGRYDLIHPDALAFLGGNIWSNDFADFDINATGYGLGVNNQNLSGTWAGGAGTWTSSDSSNNTFTRGWIHGCAGAGFQVNCFRKMDGSGTINNGTLTDFHVWGNGTLSGGQSDPGYQYIESVDTAQGITYTVGANPQPSRITYSATNSDSGVAQVGTDPATAWQATSGHSSSLADLLAYFTALGWPT